jgi:hypothetical protein
MSLSVAIPRHDRLGEFLLLLESTNGRDKFCRFIQFTAKYFKWKEEVSKARNDQRVQQWGNLSISMSTVRKVLRLFRTLAVLRAFHRALPSSSDEVSLELLCNLAAKLCLASYFFFDHFMYAQRIGLFSPPPPTLTLFNQLTEGSWLGEICFTIIEQLCKLHSIAQEGEMTSVIVGGNAIAAVVSTGGVGWEERRRQALRSLLRNALDLPIALHFLGLTGNHPHGHFGALGMASSLISLYEMWPSVFVAPMHAKVL